MKKAIYIIIAIILIISAVCFATEIKDSSEITMEILQSRKGTVLVEKCIGIVTTESKDGVILNCENPQYYYISYADIDKANKGNFMITYFVYNPFNNIEDDILFRLDFVL